MAYAPQTGGPECQHNFGHAEKVLVMKDITDIISNPNELAYSTLGTLNLL